MEKIPALGTTNWKTFPIILAILGAETGGSQTQGLPGLKTKFKAKLGNLVKLYHTNTHTHTQCSPTFVYTASSPLPLPCLAI